MNKIILIDGSSMLTSNYYGSLPKRGEMETDDKYYDRIMHTQHRPELAYTNAISVTLKKILSLITKYHPEYIAIAFDKSRNTFRKEEYPEYKGTRGNTPDPLKQQMKLMQEILTDINIPVYVSDRYEADDIIASIVKKNCSNTDEVMIITKDHDYYQLAQSNVTIWQPQISEDKANTLYEKYGFTPEERSVMPAKSFPFTPERIFKETGVMPNQIPDLKGIIGDVSDNIPGVKGISSAAAPLIRKYGSIEGIYAAIDENEKNFTQECKTLGIRRNPLNALKADRDNAFMSKHLATMAIFDVIDNLEEIKLNINIQRLYSIIEEFEIKSAESYIDSLKKTIHMKDSIPAIVEKDETLIPNQQKEQTYLNLAILGTSNVDGAKIKPYVEFLTSARPSKVFCDISIPGIKTEKFNYETFNTYKDKAYMFIIKDKMKESEIKNILSFAKNAKDAQIRFCIIKGDKISIKSLSNLQ